MAGHVLIEDLTFAYPGDAQVAPLPVLQNLSLEIRQGEFVCILGPSGCGKSTLLKLIAGLLRPRLGKISIDSRPPTETLKTQSIGFVFQNPVLLPWRSVWENIALPFELGGLPPNERAVAEAIELIGLQGFERFLPGKLSGGMRSRVAIARAFVYRPRILLMDEPFGDVDEVMRLRLNLELLRIWNQHKCTVTLVTHNLSEALFLADRLLVLRSGTASSLEVVPITFPNRELDCTSSPRFQEARNHLIRLLDPTLHEQVNR